MAILGNAKPDYGSMKDWEIADIAMAIAGRNPRMRGDVLARAIPRAAGYLSGSDNLGPAVTANPGRAEGDLRSYFTSDIGLSENDIAALQELAKRVAAKRR